MIKDGILLVAMLIMIILLYGAGLNLAYAATCTTSGNRTVCTDSDGDAAICTRSGDRTVCTGGGVD